MARTSQYPKPKKKYHRGTWEIYWNWSGDRYSLYPGIQDPNESSVEGALRRVAVALAMPMPAFPPEFAKAPAVLRYLEKRYRVERPEAIPPKPPEEVFADYELDLKRHCSKRWAKQSMKRILAFDAFANGFRKATPVTAREFLSALLDKGNGPGTRNSVLATCHRFFTWCQERGQVTGNPFTGIKKMKVSDTEEIAYCTRAERDRVIAAAEACGRPDWIAIPIALYAGCRREEVFRLMWEDVNFEARRLLIRKSKTGKKRTTPIARELLTILEKRRRERGTVVPAMNGEMWSTQADRLVELVRDHLCRPEHPNLAGRAEEPTNQRLFVMKADSLEKLLKARQKTIETLEKKLLKLKRDDPAARMAAMELACAEQCGILAHDGGEWIPAERLGWNAWRHTFATLRAQAGVSLDKISNWMGNTYDVCKKHYTQFMPRGEHEEDIDR